MTRTNIILATLNAKYIHASLGLRYLYANLEELRDQAVIMEFTIKRPAGEIAAQLLTGRPAIIGFGIYIWNTLQTLAVIQRIRQLDPGVIIIIGGPEVSHEYQDQPLFDLADYLITGQADKAFKALVLGVLGQQDNIPRAIVPAPLRLDELALPYEFYNDDDIAHRVIYVEASRGCPFKCEFCLSSLDKTAWPFDLDRLLGELDTLYRRGARNFKFVDRTFNLKVSNSTRILEFFLERMEPGLFLHFELIPDNLPNALKTLVARFPTGSLQFEIGVQSFTLKVQALISRRQNNTRTRENISWLKAHSRAHLHTDLIFGLPGETLESFADSFNQLCELDPDEIQVGILKRLRGTPIVRHTDAFKLEFDPHAPYEILATSTINTDTMKRMVRFTRFWNQVANSARFSHSLPVILENSPFDNFMALSDFLFNHFGRTHAIHLEDMFDGIEKFGTNNLLLLKMIKRDRQAHQQQTTTKPPSRQNQRQLRHMQARGAPAAL